MASEITVVNGNRKLFVNSDGSISIRDTPFKTIVDKTSSPTEYYGFANPGTATSSAYWKIMRKTVSGAIETFEFADGDANFDNVWDDRASLSYS